MRHFDVNTNRSFVSRDAQFAFAMNIYVMQWRWLRAQMKWITSWNKRENGVFIPEKKTETEKKPSSNPSMPRESNYMSGFVPACAINGHIYKWRDEDQVSTACACAYAQYTRETTAPTIAISHRTLKKESKDTQRAFKMWEDDDFAGDDDVDVMLVLASRKVIS